jgi:hypothetical protein
MARDRGRESVGPGAMPAPVSFDDDRLPNGSAGAVLVQVVDPRAALWLVSVHVRASDRTIGMAGTELNARAIDSKT